jgi:hypothetical protein
LGFPLLVLFGKYLNFIIFYNFHPKRCVVVFCLGKNIGCVTNTLEDVEKI